MKTYLGIDFTMFGFGLPQNNIHSPNERYPLTLSIGHMSSLAGHRFMSCCDQMPTALWKKADVTLVKKAIQQLQILGQGLVYARWGAHCYAVIRFYGAFVVSNGPFIAVYVSVRCTCIICSFGVSLHDTLIFLQVWAWRILEGSRGVCASLGRAWRTWFFNN